MVKLPRVTLEGSKVEKNSKQSVVTLALPVEPSRKEGRRDQGNTTLPPASVSFLLQCLWNSCWWGDYATTCASVSVASYSRSQCLCSHTNEKLSVSAESSRHSRWPEPSARLYSTVQVEQPGNAVCLAILKGGGLREGRRCWPDIEGSWSLRFSGPFEVNKGAACMCCDRQTLFQRAHHSA